MSRAGSRAPLRAAPLLAVLLLTGCGARTSILDAVSGGGGGPGPGPTCEPGTIVDSIFTIDEPEYDEQSPSLALLADGRVALAVASRPVNFAQAPQVRVGAFDAWGAWPPAAPALAQASNQFGSMVFGSTVMAAPSRVSGQTESVLAMLATGSDTEMARALSADGSGGPDGMLQWVGDGLALAADASQTTHLAITTHPGIAVANVAVTALDVAIVNDQGTLEFATAACSTTPMAADAIASGDGFLLAAASGTPFGWATEDWYCDKLGGPLLPASTLRFAHVSADGMPGPLVPGTDIMGPVVRLRLAPRSNGAWVAWTVDASVDFAAALRIVSIDAQDQIGLFVVDLKADDGAIAPASLAVAAVGDDLAVVVTETRTSGAQVLVVRRFDGKGNMTWSKELPVDGDVTSPAALMLSPQGDELLVVWSEFRPDLFAGHVQVAKLGCLGGG